MTNLEGIDAVATKSKSENKDSPKKTGNSSPTGRDGNKNTNPTGKTFKKFIAEILKRSFHGGIDIGPLKAGSEGDTIVAALSGKVINSTYQFDKQTKRGAGFYLTIESIYKGQKVHIYYMHLQENSIVVQIGDFINAGQHIVNTGKTGGAAGPHLHYEIRVFEDGKWVKKDPMSYYKSDQLKRQK